MKKVMYIILLSYILYLFPGSDSGVIIPGFSTYEKCKKIGDYFIRDVTFGGYKCILVD